MKLIHSIFTTLFRTFACFLLSLPVVGMAQTTPGTPSQERPGRLVWIERTWTTRYFLHVLPEVDWSFSKSVSSESNSRRASRPPARRFLTWPELFAPQNFVKLNVPDLSRDSNLAVIAVNFDEEGVVTSLHGGRKALRGRINRLQDLGLSSGDGLEDGFYYMADGFTGVGDSSTHWAPAFCNGYQTPDPANIRSDDYLYGNLFKPNNHRPLFGCREWAYQLYDNERPYIDVTSYELTSKGKPFKGYIREFTGWARFGDNKPVIGQHEGDWYCLHDCPGGDKPGLIPDIKVWAKRFEWFAPVPPTRVPTFPDPPAETGTYPYEQKPLTSPALTSKPQSDKGVNVKRADDEGEFPDVPADAGC